jgi:hypothetical protein
MGLGFRTFTVGEVITATNIMGYLMKQAVMSFATAAARASAVTAPEDGMLSHQIDTDTYYGYDAGTATWVPVASMRAWQSFTPSWTGSVSNPVLGNGTVDARYLQVGKTVRFRLILTMGSTTTYGSGAWGLTLPIAPSDSQAVACVYVDASASTRCAGTAWLTNGSGIFRMLPPTDAASAGIAATTPFTWATSDQVIISGTYETP